MQLGEENEIPFTHVSGYLSRCDGVSVISGAGHTGAVEVTGD